MFFIIELSGLSSALKISDNSIRFLCFIYKTLLSLISKINLSNNLELY